MRSKLYWLNLVFQNEIIFAILICNNVKLIYFFKSNELLSRSESKKHFSKIHILHILKTYSFILQLVFFTAGLFYVGFLWFHRLIIAAKEMKIVGVWGRFELKEGGFSCNLIIGRHLLSDENSTIPKTELDALTMGSNLGWI